MATYKINQKVDAVIERILPFGVFVRLPDGSPGYIRRRELDLDADVEPAEIVKEGQKIQTVVIKTEEEGNNIELSRRATLKDPWLEFAQHNRERGTVRGRVRALHPNGAFMRVQAGINGFVPLAEIATWQVDKPEDVLWIGDMVEARITEIDPTSQRLTLSIKAVMLQRDAIKTSPLTSSQPITQSSLSVSPKLSSPISSDIRDKVGAILVVDDHNEVCSSLTEWLEQRGFVAMGADSLDKAIDLFKKHDYQVLLADLNLMGKDGMDLVHHLRKNGHQTHICIMSSMDELNERAEEIEAARVLQVFPKPLDVEEIEAFFLQLARGEPVLAWRAAQKASPSPRMVKAAQSDLLPIRKRIQSTLDEVTLLIRAEIGLIFQLDPASQTISILARSGEAPLHLEALYGLNASPVEDVIRDGGSVFETHVSEKARAKFAKLLELLPFESCIGVPVQINDETQYAAFFFHREAEVFSHHRLRDAQAAALLLASILTREVLEKQIQSLNPMLLSGELARGFGHDVFNKITALDLEARLLIDQRSRDEAQTSTQHLLDLILDLKATVWAFQQLLQTKGINESFDVNQAVKNAITLLLPVAQKERAKIEVNLVPDPPYVFGNSIILQQVVLNLMLNAIQQMSLKAERFHWESRRAMRVTTSINKKEGKIRIRIADNGPGIHQAHLKKIFSHGFSTRGGSGLGLNIAQGFIQSLGGALRVQETLIPLGTTFAVEVPFDTQEADQ
jgi:signal transduction histidine kinase/DNA-binding response OmpR family regulator/predicted RNA-binding protein with RPS1 domain